MARRLLQYLQNLPHSLVCAAVIVSFLQTAQSQLQSHTLSHTHLHKTFKHHQPSASTACIEISTCNCGETWYVPNFKVGWTEFLCEQGSYPPLPSRSLEHVPNPQLPRLQERREDSIHSECSWSQCAIILLLDGSQLTETASLGHTICTTRSWWRH